jgi:hypothetical protein
VFGQPGQPQVPKLPTNERTELDERAWYSIEKPTRFSSNPKHEGPDGLASLNLAAITGELKGKKVFNGQLVIL